MRIGLKTLTLLLLAALVAVPAAGAKPGNGHGGKPSWAGSGGHGKPEWAGKGHEAKGKGEKSKAAKAENAGGLKGKLKGLELEELSAEDLEGLNPAWTCKVERLLMEVESFADEYGTNDNEANALGKCVSEEAHEHDGVSPEAVQAFCEPSEAEAAEEVARGETTEEQPAQEETTEGEGEEAPAAEEATDESEEPALCAGGAEEGSAAESEGAEGETSESDDPLLAALRSLF